MSDNTPVIEGHDLVKILPYEIPVTLVQGIDITITQGEIVSVTGPSGSGKSSLLYLLGLLDVPTEGHIELEGQKLDGLSSEKLCDLRLNKLGFVFQFHFLLPEFSIVENLMIPMRKAGLFSGERAERAMALLESLGMSDQAHKKPGQLSGGQRQRAAIARALANNPALILADEPTGNLDTKNSQAVFDIFKDLTRNSGTSVIMVTHDMDLANQADRRIHLVDGKITT
jgi:lipoprotein-releasing system ATP-binding protein